jgi:RNA:NAD 2'-phosphotransferase (TPT1/KptA family)
VILIPDSAFTEFNPNHGPDGRFTDADGVTHVGDTVELYHGTSARRASKIRKEGLRVRAVRKATMGGDPESSRNYVWLAKQRGAAQSYADLHANPTVLAVRLPVHVYDQLKRLNSGPVSVWSPEDIPSHYVVKP